MQKIPTSSEEVSSLEAPEEFVLTLEAVARAFRRQLSFEFEAAGLSVSPTEARVLVCVKRNAGLRQTQLAQLLSCEAMTIVGVLDRLEAAGLVERKPDEDDRRAKRIVLPSSAVRLVEQIETILAELTTRAEQGLDSGSKMWLRDALSRIQANLATVAAGDYLESGNANDQARHKGKDEPISPAQCRMARAGLGLSVREFAKLAQVSGLTVIRFESGTPGSEEVNDALRFALEAGGAEFINEPGTGREATEQKLRYPLSGCSHRARVKRQTSANVFK